MMEDPRAAALEAAYRNQMKQQLIAKIVDAAFDAEISGQRSQNLLRRRYLDDTLVTTSRIAIAAGMVS